MDKLEQLALQTTKEIVVKFVETGRISPSNFADHFQPIYAEILRTISGGAPGAEGAGPAAAAPARPAAGKAADKPAPAKSAPAKPVPAKEEESA